MEKGKGLMQKKAKKEAKASLKNMPPPTPTNTKWLWKEGI